jgi:ribokinase
MRLAVVGHVEWVQFVPVTRVPLAGEVVHAHGEFEEPAGGGGVVAFAFARMGAEVIFYTALGDDALGHRSRDRFAAAGIDVQVAWREQPTRRAVTLLDKAGERTIITLGERLEPVGADPLGWDALAGVDGVYFTAGDRAALRAARAAPVLVASPRARYALPEPVPLDAIVLSADDRDERDWVSRAGGPVRLLVATEGAHGGSWSGESSGRWEPVAPPHPGGDTYGCGDTFAGAFTYGLARGDGPAAAAAFAAACGAACRSGDGPYGAPLPTP